MLAELAADYPLPAKLLEHRSLAKLKGTYTDKLAQLAALADFRQALDQELDKLPRVSGSMTITRPSGFTTRRASSTSARCPACSAPGPAPRRPGRSL